MREGFEEISHTADTGIRAWSDTLSGALTMAAKGMFTLILADPPRSAHRERESLRLVAQSPADLLHALLSEVLFMHAVRRVLPVDCAVTAGEDGAAWRCEAEIDFTEMTADVQAQATEIKAVTWHGLMLDFDGTSWKGQVIFDT
ncbi:MAG: archease [Bacteroidota bacterium]|nr:archease [Bacteroidota bacterium]